MNADGSLSLRGLVAKGDMERARDRVMVYVKVGGAGGRADKCGAAKTQREMNECYGRVLKSADEELNRTFVEVANQVRDPIQKTLVQSSQEAWAAYRVNQCEFQASGVRGGSVYATVLATCMTAQARVRTRDLRSVLNCAEGDLSCPL